MLPEVQSVTSLTQAGFPQTQRSMLAKKMPDKPAPITRNTLNQNVYLIRADQLSPLAGTVFGRFNELTFS